MHNQNGFSQKTFRLKPLYESKIRIPPAKAGGNSTKTGGNSKARGN